MILMKLFGVAMILAGAACVAAGMAVGSAVLTMSGLGVAVGGVGLLVLDRLLAPVMRSSREIAEQAGMPVSRLTGAPKMGPAMANARDTMVRAQAQMTSLMGPARLRNEGVPGKAVVKAARPTGQTQNLNPVYELDLVVTPDDRSAYDVTVQSEVNTLAVARCTPGAQVSVMVDRGDQRHLWIDWLAVIPGGSGPAPR